MQILSQSPRYILPTTTYFMQYATVTSLGSHCCSDEVCSDLEPQIQFNVSVPGILRIDPDLSAVKEMQWADQSLLPMLCYLDKDTLPADAKVAGQITLESRQYCLIEGVLYFDTVTCPRR